MQQISHLVFNGTKVHVLMQNAKHGVYLKLRKGGEEGRFLAAESDYLAEHPEKGLLLMQNKTITL